VLDGYKGSHGVILPYDTKKTIQAKDHNLRKGKAELAATGSDRRTQKWKKA